MTQRWSYTREKMCEITRAPATLKMLRFEKVDIDGYRTEAVALQLVEVMLKHQCFLIHKLDCDCEKNNKVAFKLLQVYSLHNVERVCLSPTETYWTPKINYFRLFPSREMPSFTYPKFYPVSSGCVQWGVLLHKIRSANSKSIW